MNWNLPIFFSSLVGFGLVSLLYGIGFSRRRPDLLRAGVVLAAFGLLTHVVALAHEWTVRSKLPAEGWSDFVVLESTAVLVAVVVSGLSERFRVLGAFMAPVGLAVSLAALLGPGARPAAEFVGAELNPVWQGVHVGSFLLSFVALTVGFGAAVLYLMVSRRLKAGKLALLGAGESWIPSLEGLDRAVHRSLEAGLLLLTVGIVTGAVWAGFASEQAQGIAPKVVVTALAWLAFAVAMQMRWVFGWRGQRGAGLLVGGYGWLLVALFAVRHVT
jgi:ABC-type transport system involved in cytochrome c biogenesis permease subunit